MLADLNTFMYRKSGGRIGGSIDRAPVLLLHHKGAKSGQERVAPLLYLDDGDDLVIVASYGGAPKNPAWLHNLRGASGDDRRGRPRAARGHRARGDARRSASASGPRCSDLYPAYADYQARTERTDPARRAQRARRRRDTYGRLRP